MYLAGILVWCMEDIVEPPMGQAMTSSTISELNKKMYVYVDGIYLRRNWGRELEK